MMARFNGGIPYNPKARYVRNAPNPGGHKCHWPGCEAEVKPAAWGCKRHWFMLPHAIRTAIWDAYRPGQEVTKRPSERYIAAAKAAQDWITQFGNPKPKQEEMKL